MGPGDRRKQSDMSSLLLNKNGDRQRGGSTGKSPMRGIDRDGDRQRGESTGESPKRGIDREGDRQPL